MNTSQRVLEDGTEPFTRRMTLYQVWKELEKQYPRAAKKDAKKPR